MTALVHVGRLTAVTLLHPHIVHGDVSPCLFVRMAAGPAHCRLTVACTPPMLSITHSSTHALTESLIHSLTHPSHPPTAASPLGSEEVYLTNTREDNTLAKTAKMLAFPPSSQADRLAVLMRSLAAQPPVSHLTSMALLEAVAAVAVGESSSAVFCDAAPFIL